MTIKIYQKRTDDVLEVQNIYKLMVLNGVIIYNHYYKDPFDESNIQPATDKFRLEHLKEFRVIIE